MLEDLNSESSKSNLVTGVVLPMTSLEYDLCLGDSSDVLLELLNELYWSGGLVTWEW